MPIAADDVCNDPQRVFDAADAVEAVGEYEYAIELYLRGLNLDPDNVGAHQALRTASLKRKARGGPPLGMWKSMKLKKPAKDDKQNLLNAERLLAYDPANTDHMLTLLQSAERAGFQATADWIARILKRANPPGGGPDWW